jgi:CheY-like chemotaxis protein
MEKIKSILLVEDNLRDAELIIEALKELRIANAIIAVRDGEEALEYLYRKGGFKQYPPGNPVVIILDLKLPKMSGYEVLEQIRLDEKLKYVPAVMLTSSREERDKALSYERGANAYVVKPIDFQKFMHVVKELGIFWALLNEPPAGSVRKEIL